MGRYKEFLINEQMRITGNWREQDHHEYLAWRSQIEKEHLKCEGKTIISKSEHGDSRNSNEDS